MSRAAAPARTLPLLVICFACLIGAPALPALGQRRAATVTVIAGGHACHDAPITVDLPAGAKSRSAMLSGYLMLTPVRGKGAPLRAQASLNGPIPTLSFILDNLAAGESRTYRLGPVVFVRRPDRQVVVVQKGQDIEISFDTTLFTRYSMKSAPNKPVFYPILTPEGDPMTRQWPVEPDANPGESHDHPHHRGLWFTHSSVNGIDFWSEESKKLGKTVTTG